MFNIWNTIKTWWIEKIWKPSWTKAVTWFYGLPSAVVAVSAYVGSLAGDEHITQYLSQMNVPVWVPSVVALIAAIHYVAHGRNDD